MKKDEIIWRNLGVQRKNMKKDRNDEGKKFEKKNQKDYANFRELVRNREEEIMGDQRNKD